MNPSNVTPQMVWEIVVQLRDKGGTINFNVRLTGNVIVVRAIGDAHPNMIDVAAYYLRSKGWRAFQSDGPEPLVVVTGRNEALSGPE